MQNLEEQRGNSVQLEQEFANLIRYVQANVAPRTFAQKLANDLEFFRENSRENADQKTVQTVPIRWSNFLISIRGTAVLAELKRVAKDWENLERFVTGVPKSPRTAIVLTLPSKLNWEPERLFMHLLDEASALRDLKGQERGSLLISLKYLVTESQKPKIKRDQKWIASTWSFVHPTLETYGLLDAFRDEKLIKDRLRAFVRGSI